MSVSAKHQNINYGYINHLPKFIETKPISQTGLFGKNENNFREKKIFQ